ncbi:MAG: alpha/beta hydrolase [Hyphomonas sp.]|uniref:alpha/beta hydrolase n=1 Tax=Hyphomonas sp. TaxID=87 RepID=UPI00180A2ACF|nr:alpha/beta hydrolase [Hyphomonas sp.]MBA3069437.1 alpha/beta hydrolase [Hyphomonas sp.]MBU4063819.1 alpha/beta hydrolase [Alphaproteobacteria bacterium]MBU4164220.1 alpha/beta hydrolase [Alphaproteobacteria bacterium]
MRRILLVIVLLVLAGAGAGTAYFVLQPKPAKYHPQYGTDCVQLLTPATVNAVECVRVLFGTNREMVLKGLEPGLAQEQDVREVLPGDAKRLQYGRADIWLPKLVDEGGSRDRGETPILNGPIPEDPGELAKYVFLTRITKAGSEAFLAEMDQALQSRGSDSVLLFVHGFNTPFEDALIRSAQLSVDLSRRGIFDVGVPVLFSWPSAGNVSLEDYRGDQDRSLAAAPYLEQFLDVITEHAEITRINIVAHSMGNRILTKALESYAADYLERHGREDLEFRIILVAADVDRDIFEATTGILDNLKANVTIYTSDADRALHVSEIVNSKLRLGDTNGDKPFIRPDPFYQTVDATGIATELFGLGHNYYSDNPFILGDIVCALAEANPELRALERRRYGNVPDGLEYFRVNTAVRPANADCSLYRNAFPIADVRDAGVGPVEPSAAPRRLPDAVESAPPPETETETPGRAAPAPEPELESMPAPVQSAPPPPPPPPPPMVSLAPATIVFWVEDRDAFVSEAQYRERLVPALGAGPLQEIVIHAHTDSVGDAGENRVISRRWAVAVRDWLVMDGVDPAIITAEGFGEDRPAVATPDETREPLNQRIEVTIRYLP